jgi:hypothetical protein
LREGTLDIKVFDDRLILDGNTIERDGANKWGADRLGKRKEFEREANSRKKQLDDFLPTIGEKYSLGKVTIWFLYPKDDLECRRNSLGFDDFIRFLATKDPFHFLKNPTVNDLIPHFKREWKYELFWLPKPISLPILENMAALAHSLTKASF